MTSNANKEGATWRVLARARPLSGHPRNRQLAGSMPFEVPLPSAREAMLRRVEYQ